MRHNLTIVGALAVVVASALSCGGGGRGAGGDGAATPTAIEPDHPDAKTEEIRQRRDYVPPEWTVPAGSPMVECVAGWSELRVPEAGATLCVPADGGWSAHLDPEIDYGVIVRSAEPGRGFSLQAPQPNVELFGNVSCTVYAQFVPVPDGEAKVCRIPGTQLYEGDPDVVMDSLLYPSGHVAIWSYRLSQTGQATRDSIRAILLSVREIR